MQKVSLFLLSLLMQVNAFPQHKDLADFNYDRQRMSKNGLKVLATFSAANIVYGTIACSQTTGSNKYFHQMNAIWNGITLGIISVGYFAGKRDTTSTMAKSLKKQHKTEKLFLFNSALDIVYISGGILIFEKSKTTNTKQEKLKGYGQSVMLQGAALLLFDAINYTIHKRNGKKLNGLINRLQLSGAGNALRITMAL